MIVIAPSILNGKLKIQPSKSVSHRAIVCAALSQGTTRLKNVAFSDDIKATMDAVQNMGLCSIKAERGILIVDKPRGQTSEDIFCNESGSTLRFCLPLGMDGIQRCFTGKGRLLQRPLDLYEEICRKQFIRMERSPDGITVKGQLYPDIFTVRGDISSQFVSGLLFALPRLKGDSRIIFSTELQSKPYVDLTRDMQKKFGVETEEWGGDIIIYGNQEYRGRELEIEGDYSHAAFFAVGAALSGNVDLMGLNADSLQGDKQIFDILQKSGARINGHKVSKASYLQPFRADVSQIPDLVPILCVLALGAKGESVIYNAARLRYKESDRLAAMAAELKKLGGDIDEYDDKLVIRGGTPLKGGLADSHGDHRVAMAITIASTISRGDIRLKDPDVVAKSAPYFYSEFQKLGGVIR
jgi:3-phosphoshikimate 1-carboxyvinyltransferase